MPEPRYCTASTVKPAVRRAVRCADRVIPDLCGVLFRSIQFFNEESKSMWIICFIVSVISSSLRD